jgi:hypothetical protein
MATIKKPSKSMAFQNEKSNDLEKVKSAMKNGAKIIVEKIKGKESFAVEYPTGGYFKISKTIYNKLTKSK